MKQELLNKIKKYNPKWSRSIIDYLREKKEYLNSGVDESKLDINIVDMCVVGEVYGFTTKYSDDDSTEKCDDCDNFGMQLWSNSCNSYDRKEEFERLLKLFYEHVELEHKELIN